MEKTRNHQCYGWYFLSRRTGARAAVSCITTGISLHICHTTGRYDSLLAKIPASLDSVFTWKMLSQNCPGEPQMHQWKDASKRKVCCFAKGPRYNGRDCNRPDIQRFELSSRKGAGGLPDTDRAQKQHQRVGRNFQCRFTESYPPFSSTGPSRLSCGLSQPQLQPSAQEPQPQPLPLATQLSQILKRTLLKLQYILFLASKYPSVSTYSWLFRAILQPAALNLSVLDFLLHPYRRKKHFQASQAFLYISKHYHGGWVMEVVLSWCPCHHTLPGEQRGQNVPRCFGAHRTAHRQLLSTEQKKTHLKPSTQLDCNVTPKAGNHTLSRPGTASSQILTTIWSSEATETLLSSK